MIMIIKAVTFSRFGLFSSRAEVTVSLLVCVMHSGQAAVVSENAGKYHGCRSSRLQSQEPRGSPCCSWQLWSSHVYRQGACRHNRYGGCCHGDEVWSVWPRRVNSCHGYKRLSLGIFMHISEMLFGVDIYWGISCCWSGMNIYAVKIRSVS